MRKFELFLAGTLATAGACGDDHDHDHDTTSQTDTVTDSTATETSATETSATETTSDDTVGDGEVIETPFVPPTPMAITQSAAGPDQLQAVVAAPDGKAWAVGFAAADVQAGTPRTVFLMKLGPTGVDTSFGGGDGIVTLPIDFRGGNDELDLETSGDALVITAVVADETTPIDTDIVVMRVDANGAPDTTFGGGDGLVVLDLGAGIVDGTTVTGGDRVRAVAVDGQGRIYLHNVRLADTPEGAPARTDTDFSLIRLEADGDIDTSFGVDGEHIVDIRGGAPDLIPSNATPRGIAVLADGSILAGGYATTDGLGTNPQAVLYKLDEDGERVPGFAVDGLFHDIVLSTQTEVYGFAVHGDELVTAGYGRESGSQNDWVSLRFDVATGARDETWGGAANGAVLIDPSGAGVGDNCRGARALPGGKTLLFGSSGPNNAPEQDAAFAVLDADGHLDTAYGDGVHTLAFGDGAGGNDQFWGAAVSGDRVYLVGYRGGGPAADQTADANDDAWWATFVIE